ncbi:MAG: lysophospholipid acyltransferase family protein [Candidatus Andeanibacterium colombiense]|uniref:Lysophospholipid acyltransferase family protein n=1 Tax=Candidatus Andeanibacterium colombiense TaxID=3121345 RepID=A0AAJ6BNK1_9SPHN|nr:MAG: lysophospholipid acyltransferase family protein [Sphingomonadaceae bacterium]
MGDALALEQTRIAPLGWALIGLRLLLMLALLLVCAPLYYVWKLLGLGRFWPRVFLGGVGLIAGLDIRIEGRPARQALLLSNHVSWLDIPAIAWASGSAFVGHSGLASIGLLKTLCAMNDTVFIARHDRGSVADQVEQVRQAIAGTGALTFFPEGTTSDGTGLLPFKSSLLSAVENLPEGVPIQPVLLDYAEAPGISWVGDEHGLDNFKRILARGRSVHLTIHFLPPLSGPELTNRKTMAAAAREAILRAMAR